ncbi:MAG: hypothetical protein H6737_00680 [Alphaproteobacteria bacterium]|nr:hypothetical protein [Alphaproteobacteria bacterium]
MKNLCFAAAFAACALVPSAASAGDTHFRWGVGGGTGYFAPAGLVDFNVGLRLGAQFNEKMGVYGELGSVFGFGFGGSVSENGASLRAKAVGLYGLTPVFEYSFGGGFIGGGPVLARGSWVAVKQSADDQGNVSQSAYVAGGSFVPGLDFRVGAIAGKADERGRRKGFSIALDTKMLLAKVTSVDQNVSGSNVSQGVEVGKSTVGITPMLVFGFDAR